MKINIFKEKKQERPGYTNVNHLCANKLDEYCDDGELKELVANGILNLFPSNTVASVLMGWLGKLAHGGILHLSAPEIDLICNGFSNGDINLDQFNEMVHSGLSSFTVESLVNFFTSKGYLVIDKRIVDYTFYLKVQRPQLVPQIQSVAA